MLPGAASNSAVYTPNDLDGGTPEYNLNSKSTDQKSLDAKAQKRNLPIVKSVVVINTPYNLPSTMLNNKNPNPQFIQNTNNFFNVKYQQLFDVTCDDLLLEDVSEKIVPYFEILIHFIYRFFRLLKVYSTLLFYFFSRYATNQKKSFKQHHKVKLAQCRLMRQRR